MSPYPKYGSTEKLVVWIATDIYPWFAPKKIETPPNAVKVVCISDTHNTEPELPDGDVLLHAGDLTMGGNFYEMQRQLEWLDNQPHKYKIVIGGNHDSILDSAFMDKHFGDLGQKPGLSFADLDWGTVTYLKDSSVVLEFPRHSPLKIHGVPHTPKFGTFAFQHPRTEDIWQDTLSADTDILLTHGPPLFHLDTTNWGDKVGSPHLLREIQRAKPRVVVFGHIHEGHGQEIVKFDRAERIWQGISTGERATWLALLELVLFLVGRKILEILHGNRNRGVTHLINAAVMEGHSDKATNAPTVLYL